MSYTGEVDVEWSMDDRMLGGGGGGGEEEDGINAVVPESGTDFGITSVHFDHFDTELYTSHRYIDIGRMKHGIKLRKLQRTPSHRWALLR